MTAIEIRPLAQADRAFWAPLWQAYLAFYKADIADEVTDITWCRLLDPGEPVAGALAWRGNDAVGLVHRIRHRSSWTIGDYCYLQDLFVAPEARAAGVGRRLIEHVYEAAAAEGCSRVHWLTHETNADAMKLYDRIADRSGFVQYRKLMGS
jgi:GNAT superfamily N-acetyltransferase